MKYHCFEFKNLSPVKPITLCPMRIIVKYKSSVSKDLSI